MARIWRDGQKKDVKLYRLLTYVAPAKCGEEAKKRAVNSVASMHSTGSIEEKIWQRQIMKTGLSDAIVDDNASSANAGHFTMVRSSADATCTSHTLTGGAEESLPTQQQDPVRYARPAAVRLWWQR